MCSLLLFHGKAFICFMAVCALWEATRFRFIEGSGYLYSFTEQVHLFCLYEGVNLFYKMWNILLIDKWGSFLLFYVTLFILIVLLEGSIFCFINIAISSILRNRVHINIFRGGIYLFILCECCHFFCFMSEVRLFCRC